MLSNKINLVTIQLTSYLQGGEKVGGGLNNWKSFRKERNVFQKATIKLTMYNTVVFSPVTKPSPITSPVEKNSKSYF